jgi:hypothetical protein
MGPEGDSTEGSEMMSAKKFLVLLPCLLLLVPLLSSEQQKPFKRRLSLKLTGGGGFALIGSVNRSLGLLNNNDAFKDLRENDPDSISGELKGLNNWLVDWEVELRMDLSPKISLGIAASAPYHCRKESSLSFAVFEDGKRGPRSKTLLYRPEARVSMPIKFNFYYSRRYWKKPRVILNAGIGYYPARLSQYSSVWIDNAFGSDYLEVKAKFPIGVHGGVSLEYPVLKNLFMVMDIQARYVSLGNLQGRREINNSDGTYYEWNGTLYAEEVPDAQIPAYYEQLVIYETPPGYRNATLDLTGVVLRVGIRVPLF